MAEKSKYQDIDAVDAALDKGVSALEKATDLELEVGCIVDGDYASGIHHTYISSSNEWNNTTNSDCTVIKVNKGDSIHIEGAKCQYTFLNTLYGINVNHTTPDFVTGESLHTNIKYDDIVAPKDCYFYLLDNYGGTDKAFKPTILTINGINEYIGLRESLESICSTDNTQTKVVPSFVPGYWNTSATTPESASGYNCISEVYPVKKGDKITLYYWNLRDSGAAGYLYSSKKIKLGDRLNGSNFTKVGDRYEYLVENESAAYIGIDFYGDAYQNAFFVVDRTEKQIDKKLLCNYIRNESSKVVDVFMFMGQSNMAGRGVTNSTWTNTYPIIKDGAGFEYRAITAPTTLCTIKEPFGVSENLESGINDYSQKTGSMVTSFVNAYYAKTKIPIIGVSASVGGTNISQWQPDGALLTDAKRRLSMAVSFLQNNGYTIRHKYMVWCQGESDGDINRTQEEYTTMFDAMFNSMKTSGIEKCFIVRIGKYNGTSARDYTTIINTQNDICKSNIDVIMVSTAFASFKEDGLMKDDWHYYQEAYNRVGDNAGANTAEYVIGRKEPIMFDPMTNGLYFSKWSY